jgi:hypothetical protein
LRSPRARPGRTEARITRHFFGLAIAGLGFAGPASAAQAGQEIVGYAYSCKAKVEMPLPSGDLEGDLILAEDGTRESFFAQLYGMTLEADPVGWATAKQLRRLGKSSVLRWNMTWREQGDVPMSFGAGLIGIDVSTGRKLALENKLVLSRDDFASEPLTTGARRWPGRKSGAGFLFEFSKLLAFAGDSNALRYRLYTGSTPDNWRISPRRLRATGWFDLAAPRSVAAPFARLRAELLARAENYKSACERRPVHYNPDTGM